MPACAFDRSYWQNRDVFHCSLQQPVIMVRRSRIDAVLSLCVVIVGECCWLVGCSGTAAELHDSYK